MLKMEGTKIWEKTNQKTEIRYKNVEEWKLSIQIQENG